MDEPLSGVRVAPAPSPAGAPDVPPRRRASRGVLISVGVVSLVIAAVAFLFTQDHGDAFTLVSGANRAGSYLSVFLLIAGDAVIPIFPGETTLNAASTLAAQDQLALALVIMAGALGAIVGDSALFLIARRSAPRLRPRVERAQRNAPIAAVFAFLDRGAPVLLLAARYIPGLRFMVNSTLGMSDMPYRKFLPWSALGGTIWSAYTCLLAYWVGSTLDDYPLASVVISGAITSAIIAAFLLYQRSRGAIQARPAAADPPPEAGGG